MTKATVKEGRKLADGFLRKQRRQCVVILVERPAGWVPTGVDDIPPNVELHAQDSVELAQQFTEHFNGLQLANPCGWWAVRPV